MAIRSTDGPQTVECGHANVVDEHGATVGPAQLGHVQMVLAIAQANQHPLGTGETLSPLPRLDSEHSHVV
jgi:hypothetical protein